MLPKRRTFRLIVAWLALGAGVWALTGCFYVPHLGKNRAPSWQNSVLVPPELIGTPEQHRQLTIGLSTLDDVRRVFGSSGIGPLHLQISPDKRFAYRTYTQVSGYLVFPLCFFESIEMPKQRCLRLTFDQAGHLEGYEIFDNETEALKSP
jgi:hypothetical protein